MIYSKPWYDVPTAFILISIEVIVTTVICAVINNMIYQLNEYDIALLSIPIFASIVIILCKSGECEE